MLALLAGAILGPDWSAPITTPPPGSTTLHFLPNHQCTGAGEYSDADGKHPYCTKDEARAACVAAGADYVDLCGEPEFIDRMQLKFGVPAVLAGVLVVHACAIDSVPADVGCLFTALQFAPPARCAHAMMYHTADWPAGVKGAAGHATTFFAAVHGFANVGATRRQRKELLAALEARVPGSTKEAPTVGPKTSKRTPKSYQPR